MAKPLQNVGCTLATQDTWKPGREETVAAHCRLCQSRASWRRRCVEEPSPIPQLHSMTATQQAGIQLRGCLRMVKLWILSSILL